MCEIDAEQDPHCRMSHAIHVPSKQGRLAVTRVLGSTSNPMGRHDGLLQADEPSVHLRDINGWTSCRTARPHARHRAHAFVLPVHVHARLRLQHPGLRRLLSRCLLASCDIVRRSRRRGTACALFSLADAQGPPNKRKVFSFGATTYLADHVVSSRIVDPCIRKAEANNVAHRIPDPRFRGHLLGPRTCRKSHVRRTCTSPATSRANAPAFGYVYAAASLGGRHCAFGAPAVSCHL